MMHCIAAGRLSSLGDNEYDFTLIGAIFDCRFNAVNGHHHFVAFRKEGFMAFINGTVVPAGRQ